MHDGGNAARSRRNLEIALATQLGSDSSWTIYDRTRKVPMNSALDVAVGMLKQPFDLVWVEGGRPELYVLDGLDRLVVVYSSRFLELSAHARQIFELVDVGPAYVERAAEQVALKVIAELLLRDGSTELALSLFGRGVVARDLRKDIVLLDAELMAHIELMPIGPAYMALWFFGLFHELGHAAPQIEHDSGPFSLAEIEINLIGALVALGLEKIGVEQIMRELEGSRANPLSSTHVLRELSADVFATRAIFAATESIMLEIGEPFDVEALIDEVFGYLAVVWFLERCEATAMLLARGMTRENMLRMVVHPATYMLRLDAVRRLLVLVLADDEAASQELDERIQDKIRRHGAAMAKVDNGFGAALRCVFDANTLNTADLDALLITVQLDPFATLESKAFCKLARTLGVNSPSLARLSRVLDDLPGLDDIGEGSPDSV